MTRRAAMASILRIAKVTQHEPQRAGIDPVAEARHQVQCHVTTTQAQGVSAFDRPPTGNHVVLLAMNQVKPPNATPFSATAPPLRSTS
ncbi:conserved hypothetical protein [Thiomonas arsenitoxydans]|uniref:Uncharacterized protein n=1 Tax=Thiomonas arsenitoxydans (strain DSM 22701 / CIP 110005 / 3As) TaxID=426114 RepID=D6CTM3_THIA3|nr:hypothetical protein THI_1979 [Thiomonas arsenitoxydans]CQR27760.1 conserved hypothetical protein [Thiomonas arsenitoxydans]CQR32024.1 conserved hypothetical protein [Thiomonas arsenitoxydans]CQR34721.1 conserved hypothetical protein [Thiomonas arsenitoxydans]CQR34796.1 conserved hypothetical protein [Thiomonas arsenitoxydans]